MNTLRKLIAQMRQYVHENDTGHECRVSSHTVTAWANTVEQELAKYNRPIVDRIAAATLSERNNDASTS